MPAHRWSQISTVSGHFFVFIRFEGIYSACGFSNPTTSRGSFFTPKIRCPPSVLANAKRISASCAAFSLQDVPCNQHERLQCNGRGGKGMVSPAIQFNIVQAYYTGFYQYIPLLYAVTWVAFSFTELIVSISSLPVLPSNRRVNRMGWSKGGFISTALLST